MNKIRVVVANRPRLMRELVLATISDQPDIEAAGEIKNDADIAQVIADSQPDFLILALDRAEERPSLCDDLLRQYPKLKILALAPERNTGTFFWSVVQIHFKPLECSEEGILNVLRGMEQPVEHELG